MRGFLTWRNAALAALVLAAVGGGARAYVAARLDVTVTTEMRQAGRELFVRQWTPHDPQAKGDGLGPVFNANSCLACHFQGGVGGGGDAVHNVTAYEVHPTTRDRKLNKGLVHAFAVDKSFVESRALVKTTFPIIPGGDRVVGGCTVKFEDFDPVRIDTANSIALFGDGLIDRLSEAPVRRDYARRMVTQLGKEIGGEFRNVGAGRPRTLPDGRLGKFGWKAQFATLKEFVAAACANELGLGNPMMEQAKPWARHAVTKAARDLDESQFHSLVAFVDTLPRPNEVILADPTEQAHAER